MIIRRRSRVVCVIAAVFALQGCIAYTVGVGNERFTSKHLQIAAANGAGELAVGALLGLAAHEDPEANAEGASQGATIIAVIGGILVFDALIALVIAPNGD